MEQPAQPWPRIGDRVELRDAAYGYPAGATGVVASTTADGRVLVRFEGIGHAVFVDSALLGPVADS